MTTIADKLYQTDRETLRRIIKEYRLIDLEKLYFPATATAKKSTGQAQAKEIEKLMKLMLPGTYSGRVQRANRRITQKHYKVLK